MRSIYLICYITSVIVAILGAKELHIHIEPVALMFTGLIVCIPLALRIIAFVNENQIKDDEK